MCILNIFLKITFKAIILLTKYKDITDHPIKRALEKEISFSINTDDPGPFDTDMNREYAIVQKAFDLTKDDFDKILKNSLNASFGSLNNRIKNYFN